MKVKVIESFGGVSEESINEFIIGKNVIDIKFSVTVEPSGSIQHTTRFTALILYEE